MTPALFPGGVSLWKEVSVLGTPQQVLPSAVSGGGTGLQRAGRSLLPVLGSPAQEQIHTLDPHLSLSPLSF